MGSPPTNVNFDSYRKQSQLKGRELREAVSTAEGLVSKPIINIGCSSMNSSDLQEVIQASKVEYVRRAQMKRNT